ncbi:MAG TPA: tail fiber domain-containing protein [Thermoanaerobaculia bacterium]|nr:tail fiber domain-containing protein [Thermoanaerobaculia bacterium]
MLRISAVLLCLAVPCSAFAGNAVGKPSANGATMEWPNPSGPHESVELVVSFPNGDSITKTYGGNRPITLRLSDLGSDLPDGQYTWEVRVAPTVSSDVAKKLKSARAANDDAAARKIMREAGLTGGVSSGSFSISGGVFVSTPDTEARAESDSSSQKEEDTTIAGPATTPRGGKVAVNDQVIPDDLIVQGSTCVGFDCVNNESFGFDTIKLKENSTRIKFEDTSTGSFPSNDWQLTANDPPGGTANRFSIEDITGATVPFTVTAGASTNSIFIDSTGRVGFRTATPVLDLHVSTSNTPALRLEQTNAGGFTAQTWDVAGNEANFFVRDVTGGSRLPFRIRPGATTSSIDISSVGSVGINDASPNSNAKLDVNGSQRYEGVAAPTFDNAAWVWNESGIGYTIQAGGAIRMRTGATSSVRMAVTAAGDVGINCTAPTADFVIFATPDCSGSGSTINAGATQFTATSSRTMKENLEPVNVPDLLARISKVGVYNYDFKTGPKDRVGLMAEDFHGVFGRGSDKVIDGNEVQMALWMAVQQLTEQNKQLQERLDALEQQKQQ